MSELQLLRVTFHGHVQGVSFRWYAQNYAQELGVKGTVRNCEDGTVELVAEGSEAKLDALLDRLCGPHGPGNVTRIEKKVEPLSEGKFQKFEIL